MNEKTTSEATSRNRWTFGEFVLDEDQAELRRGSEVIELRAQSFEVLQFLVANPGRLISRDTLLDEVWRGKIVTEDSLTHCLGDIRKALGDTSQSIIRTVRGRGYIFRCPVSVARAHSTQSIASREEPVAARRAFWGLRTYHVVAILVLALVIIAYDKWWIGPPPDNSIAVLPFVNISDDLEQEYFSDGLSEELLNLLAKVPELRVAARTSSFSFKGKDLEILEIASRLKVAHILEGSVRKSGNQIRITAQLIQADSGYHLWSESYDRELDNIFQIQEEIAIAVANALKITLFGDVPKTRKTDPQAYQLFLEGQYLKRQISVDSLLKAIEAFKQAVEIDPAYVPAWASLTDSYIWVGENDLADQAIQIAISTDPSYAYSYYARGIIRIFSKLRFKEGIEDFQHALKLDPDNAFIVASIGKGASITGKYDVAIEQFQAGLRLEPVTPEFYFFLGMTYRRSGRLDDSEASYRKMLSLSPRYWLGPFRLWHTLFLKGEFDAALAELEQETWVSAKATGLAITHYALGNEAQSDEILAGLVEKAATRGGGGYLVAMVYGYRGEVDRAFEWLNHALENEDGDLVWILGETAFHGLHSDPRWQPFLEKVNLLEYWLEMPPEWGGPQ